MARVIAFEGVDGAGKSSVLERVAAGLREAGERVCVPRAGKQHQSRPVREIRRLTRERRNLELEPRAELLLYAAREAQVLDQHVRPAVGRGETVLLDRSMLTPVVLGAWGRGLELAACERIVDAAAAGLSPELTLIFDADTRTSRIRKRLEDVRAGQPRDSGRKGLSGSGFRRRVRAGYLALAERDGLPIVHTQRGTVEDVAARVLELLARGDAGQLDEPADADLPWWRVEPELTFSEAVATLPLELQLYFTRELPLGRPIRAALLEQEPELAIWASDLEDPLLDLASRSHPVLVLARLGASPRADALRQQLAATHPIEVARSLVGITGSEADSMREQLIERAPGAVVESLLGRRDALAEALRERLWPAADTLERALSLRGLDDEGAWRRREALLEEDPAVTLPSLISLAPARVDPVLDRWLAHAPKPVLRALAGRRDAHAHALRFELLEREELGAEVLDSIIGQDDPQSWVLRERCVERWPSCVVGSLIGLPSSARATALVEQCRRFAPGDMFLARRLVAKSSCTVDRQQGVSSHGIV
jgi:dTMP kinase